MRKDNFAMQAIRAFSLKSNPEPPAAPIPKVQRLHAKGARLVGEILAELGAEHGLGTIIDQKLTRYLELDDAALDATGAHAFPISPLHGVEP